MENMNDELNRDDIFVELAKTKSMPKKLEVESMSDDDSKDESEEEGKLTIDVFKDDEDIVVQSAVAGVESDDLEINITSESVTIRGKREKENKVEDKNYYYQECFWGGFSRSVVLPEEIDADKAVASLKNGVLTIRMPKLNRQKAKKLKVKHE